MKWNVSSLSFAVLKRYAVYFMSMLKAMKICISLKADEELLLHTKLFFWFLYCHCCFSYFHIKQRECFYIREVAWNTLDTICNHSCTTGQIAPYSHEREMNFNFLTLTLLQREWMKRRKNLNLNSLTHKHTHTYT
jgi:hypothetical protein